MIVFQKRIAILLNTIVGWEAIVHKNNFKSIDAKKVERRSPLVSEDASNTLLYFSKKFIPMLLIESVILRVIPWNNAIILSRIKKTLTICFAKWQMVSFYRCNFA
jgi:hypothetical protein